MTIRRLRFCYWHPLLLLLSIAVSFLVSGCLWGVVTDAETGATIGGATVRYADSTGQTGTTTADANGMYSFDGSNGPVPAAGPVNFAVDAGGYEPLAETRQVGLGGVQSFALAPEPGTYSNAEWGFSIKFPETWMVQDGDEVEAETGMVVAGVAPPENVDDEFGEVVGVGTIDDMPEGMSLEMFFQVMMQSLEAGTPGFKQLEDGEATINGREARWAVFSLKVQRLNMKTLAYFLLSGERAYMILCTDESTQFMSHRGELEEIANSFRIY
ncbi:MAG: hypothetical protein A2Y61_00060 [Chloroflexi bacterium RBG_13_60_13]|nr:MAG: hypothetical protein A2Y61_00060 [Chloroflexi bacterium RBG_13_60_13]